MKKRRKPGPKPGERTTLIRVTVKAHRALKVEARKAGRKLVTLASEKLLASPAA